MRIERYVFGSVKGYGQLARSPGISDADARAFDTAGFSFHEPPDASFGASLKERPSFFTASVSGGRWAVVRVLAGAPDDNGRPTLILFWLVVDRRDWDNSLNRNPQPLLDTAGLWKYDGRPALQTLQITLPPPAPPVQSRLLPLLNDIRRNFAARRTTVVSASDYSAADLLSLAASAPPDLAGAITVAYRSLSAKFPVTVNAVDEDGKFQGVARPSAGGAVTVSAPALADPAGQPGFEIEPVVVGTGLPMGPKPAITERPMPQARTAAGVPVIIALAALAVGAPLAGYVVAHNQSRQQSLDQQQAFDAKIKELSAKVEADAARATAAESLADSASAAAEHSQFKLRADEERLAGLQQSIDKLKEKQLDDRNSHPAQPTHWYLQHKSRTGAQAAAPAGSPTTKPAEKVIK